MELFGIVTIVRSTHTTDAEVSIPKFVKPLGTGRASAPLRGGGGLKGETLPPSRMTQAAGDAAWR